MNELIGKYLNGYKIVRIEKDPCIKGQINLWTDEEDTNTFGDRHIVKFFIREESNTTKVYQELADKEKYELQQRINKTLEKMESWLFALDYAERDRLKIIMEILKGVE